MGEQKKPNAGKDSDHHEEGERLKGGGDIDQADTKAGAEFVDDVFGEGKNTVINAEGAD